MLSNFDSLPLVSSSFEIVTLAYPYTDRAGVVRIFVCNADNRMDRIELSPASTEEQIEAARLSFGFGDEVRTIVLAERNAATPANAPAPVASVKHVRDMTDTDYDDNARRIAAAMTPRAGGTFSAADDVRAARDEAAARAAGFAVARPVYERGTLVIDLGVDNARKAREEWEAMPRAEVECKRLADIVRSEKREDRTCEIPRMTMRASGNIATGAQINTSEGVRDELVRVEREALPQIFQRASVAAGCSSPGGSMTDWTGPKLIEARARCFNAIALTAGDIFETQRSQFAELAKAAPKLALERGAPKAPTMVVRTRLDGKGVRGAFAAVSESYTAVDADKLAEACQRVAKGTELRGEIFYDGRNTKIDLLAHSNVRPENYVAGEMFRAGVRLMSNDTGGGSIKVRAVLWRNLCLNLIIIDESVLKIGDLRHIGNVDRLSKAIDEKLAEAAKAIEHYMHAWDVGCKKTLAKNLRAERGSERFLAELIEGATKQRQADDLVREILAGTFRGLVAREILPIGKRGLDTAVEHLIEAHDDKRNRSAALAEGPSAASIANAVSLYAHAYQSDARAEAELEVAAGKVLSLKGALPWAAPAKDLAA